MKGAEELKIKVESVELPETEVIIRGDVTSEEVVSLLQLLKKRNSGKLILYKEEEQYIVDADEIVFIEVSDNKVCAYTRQDTYEAKQDFVYKNEFVKKVVESYGTKYANDYEYVFSAVLKRMGEEVDTMSVSAVIISDTGVEVASESLPYVVQ